MSKELKTITFEEIYKLNVKNIPYLLEGVFLTRCLNGFYGQSDIGKSRILMQLAYAVAAGKETFLGIKLNTKTKKVLVVNFEDNPTFVSLRLNKDFENSQAPVGLKNIEYLNGASAEELKVELSKKQYDLVVIDPFAAYAQGDLNSLSVVRSIIDPLTKLADIHKTCIIIVHHVSKANGSKTFANKAHIHGSSGFEQACRVAVEFNKVGANKRTLTVVKGNYLKDDEKEFAYLTEILPDGIFSNTSKISRTQFSEDNSSHTSEPFKLEAIKLLKEGKKNKEVKAFIQEKYNRILPDSTLSDWKNKCWNIKELEFENEKDENINIDTNEDDDIQSQAA
jgi:RecA-family ATPase